MTLGGKELQYSVGVEYALHCLTYLIDVPKGSSIGIKDIATYQGISETYLSKIFTKLAKSDIVRSMPGVKGGYQLARHPENISFLDVIHAIEGSTPLFRCTNIREKCVLLQDKDTPEYITCTPCTIHVVMLEAEQQAHRYLQTKSLVWLHQTLKEKLPPQRQEDTVNWFRKTLVER